MIYNSMEFTSDDYRLLYRSIQWVAWNVMARIDKSPLFPIIYVKQDYAYSMAVHILRFINKMLNQAITIEQYYDMIAHKEIILVKEV